MFRSVTTPIMGHGTEHDGVPSQVQSAVHIYIPRDVGRCHDQCGARSGLPQLFNKPLQTVNCFDKNDIGSLHDLSLATLIIDASLQKKTNNILHIISLQTCAAYMM